MRVLLSCFCWAGRISRRSWLAHSLVATAFLLLGVCLSFWYVTSYALGDPLFALADTVLTFQAECNKL